ncbi:unnamed protein product [Rotaria sordida]|uniref:Poly [ADP-ribose] polymerase n=2 Tax=Rotaria sordida TaxID=392033 RepID=A0A815QV24_9BILA|nr:unnamed protein product [Rotaria sordida]
MAINEDAKKAQEGLKTIIDLVQKTFQELKRQPASPIDTLGDNAASSINFNTFSCSTADDKTMETLTVQIEHLFNEFLMTLSGYFREYIFNLLCEYQYHKSEKKFKQNFTIGNLLQFLNDLEAIRDSINAFKAAWDGKLNHVKEFLTKYPTYKDKPGPWGTTLLYSAAKNGHIELVKSLIVDIGCSVNAQNQQHIERALSFETITADDYKVIPKAGSTALHGACFEGHLDVVKCLVEYGANYFIRNQAEETPLENIETHGHITEYFKTIINPGYSIQRKSLPKAPILQGSTIPGEDCIWEYKSLFDNEWLAFDINESKYLSESLVIKPGEKFQHEVHLNVDVADYSVSTIQFLRLQQSMDQHENLAWVRCRGSSILNFDCYALWQILFVKHPEAQSNNVMCLDFFDLPTMDDMKFRIQLNVWYNCDAKTNSTLDETMNNLKRYIDIDMDSIANEKLTFDLLKFSFKNKQSTISGFIRWTPKLVSNNEHNKTRPTNIDNFQLSTNSEPIPLTTRRLKEALHTTSTNISVEEREQMSIDDENYDNYVSSDNGNQENDLDDSIDLDSEDKINQSSRTHLLPLDALQIDEDTQTSTVLNNSENETDINQENYFNDSVANDSISQLSLPIKASTPSEETEALKKKLGEMNKENKKVKERLAQANTEVNSLFSLYDDMKDKNRTELEERKKEIDVMRLEQEEKEQKWLQIEKQTKQKYEEEIQSREQKMSVIIEEVTMLNEKQTNLETRMQTLKNMEETIKNCEYSGFHSQVMHDFILPKFDLLINYIKESIPNTDEYFIDKIPKLTFVETNDATYAVTLRGFPDHHTAFVAARNRIFSLSNSVNSAKEFYQRDINRIIRSISRTLTTVQVDTNNWKQYSLLAQLLTNRPGLKSKLKVIISSATLDSSVPRLFRQIPNISFAKFEMPQMATRYPVKKIARRNENILDIVLELYKKRERHDQILCFVNSVSEVNQCCRLLAELSQGTIGAVALVQSQSPKVQQANIETRSVFFSTTVAETSLTFPSLKYVIDTGMINVPVYDPDSKRTVLKEVRAAESTIKQRLGRLGRTRSGEYYYLYDFNIEDQRYPIPHIRQSDLTSIEFSLRRSPIRNGLHYMQKFFPDEPTPEAMNAAVDDLRKLVHRISGILEAAPSNEFTQHGICLAKLPDFGSLAMSKAVLAALKNYHCGRDLICLSSILSVLNTTNVLKSLPQNIKSSDGDFMTLLNIMNDVLLVKQSVQTDQFDLDRFCKAKGLDCIRHIIKQALDRYTSLEKAFHSPNNYRQQAQMQSGNWEYVAKSLLAGYSDNVFVSMKDLQEKTHQYGRYKDTTDLAVLDLQSTLVRPISEAPVSIVLARDVRYSTAVRSTAILSFIGEVKPSWIECSTKRSIKISDKELTHLRSVLPRLLHPKIRKQYPDIEKRIARITDSKRTMVDLYNGIRGRGATRETRMEAVAWIAVCKFHCKLEGGFVRDWVIGHYREPQQRTNNPKSWIQYRTTSNGQRIPCMNRDIVPADLDCHLPLDRYFDVDKFRDELYKFDLTCEVIREDWRYVLLIDDNAPTGPFTMDLIEPHVVLTHDRIDLDVSNLSLEKDYPHEIGMRIDITQSPYSIELETIVQNIMNKHFQVLRPLDNLVKDRIQRMTQRQWTQIGEPTNYIPRPYVKYNAVLAPLPPSSTLYQALLGKIKTIGNSVRIISIDEIKNPLLEDTYEAMKKIIARECKGNPNEQKLYHGTRGDAINGIVEAGFDDRFFSPTGAWGHGTYFADDPRKSHDFTAANPINQTRVIFYNKVILGKESIMNQANNSLTSAPKGFHSVRGTEFSHREYIVYRYAQALPYLKITYIA